MSSYLVPIFTACLFFPLLAGLFTMPYVLVQYRKYGSIPFLRISIVYSFILYLTTAYFLVILPLPSLEEVRNLTSPTTQLIPFQFLTDFFEKTSLVLNNPATYLTAFKEPWFYQVIYNILLFVPFGIYLRYYFNCSLKKTVMLSLGFSLFFEITQLTGLYGIYPRGYRLFDVDDLLINTLGGILGYSMVQLIEKIFPTRKALDQSAYKKGRTVSLFRRLTAFSLDSFLFLQLGSISLLLLSFLSIKIPFILFVFLFNFFYYVIIPYLQQGRTFGKQFLKLKLVTMENETPKFYQYCIRNFFLYFIIVPLPLYSFLLLHNVLSPLIQNKIMILLIGMLVMGIFFLFLIEECIRIGMKKQFLFYEKWSQTKNISTIEWNGSIEEDSMSKEESHKI